MTSRTRTNRLRETVESGNVALGVLDGFYHPAVVEICGDLGLDFVWHDFEHAGPSPWDAEALENLLRAADATGTELLVRLPVTEPALARKVLDAGVRNVFFSRVRSAEELRAAVEATRFEYDGEPGQRGLASPRASRWGLADDYPGTEDREVFVGVTLENPEAIDDLDEILSVPELGFVFIGPYDLSVAHGHPGEVAHPDVQRAVETIRERSLDADVTVGGLGFGMDDVNEKAEEGYRIINVGSTPAAVSEMVSSRLEAFEGERS
ncbi:HpcH/HpaI aldolase family protein [Halegenticoccus tardaugens]|uniref:HpcH/HpaI aldolase family protein n=1 Tax=Halegenticoccus tardaugens TaxID=2071624 RepID=UPI00100C2C8A|nr:aldolase/citrate lyase family protein [Halegenticoccus tardaugens]